MNCIYLVSKFSDREKGKAEYYSEAPSMWKETTYFTTDKRKAKQFKNENKAEECALKYNAYVSIIPVI